MAANVVINGVTYNNVPRVEIPLSGGDDTAAFYDTSDATLNSGDKMLSGSSAYANGTKYIGTIETKQSTDISMSGNTISVPAGYYGNVTTWQVPAGAVSVSGTGSATVDTLSYAWDATNHVYNVTGSGAVTGTAVGAKTAGYITAGNVSGAVTGTATVAATVPQATALFSASGTKTVKPDIARTGTSAAGATNVGTGTASTTAPSSGYFVSVQSAAKSSTLTLSGSAASSGYAREGDSIPKDPEDPSVISVGASASSVTYITVPGGSATAPASISGSSAAVTAGTNTITLSKAVSVTPSVTAGYIASGTAGNSAVSLTASVPTRAAATITPTTSDQTIASGTYLTGAQTIKGDANLQAAYIASGVTIFGVQGTLSTPVISQDSTTKVLSIS